MLLHALSLLSQLPLSALTEISYPCPALTVESQRVVGLPNHLCTSVRLCWLRPGSLGPAKTHSDHISPAAKPINQTGETEPRCPWTACVAVGIICPAGLNGIAHGWMVGKSVSAFLKWWRFVKTSKDCKTALRDRTRLTRAQCVSQTVVCT